MCKCGKNHSKSLPQASVPAYELLKLRNGRVAVIPTGGKELLATGTDENDAVSNFVDDVCIFMTSVQSQRCARTAAAVVNSTEQAETESVRVEMASQVISSVA